MSRAYVIGIGGPSGAGKTFLAEHLAEVLPGSILAMDAYYRDLKHLPDEQRARTNFDEPAAIEHELLIQHVAQLRLGHAIQAPCYDFATHTRLPQTTMIVPGPCVIVEGLFALYWPELRELCDSKIYVEMANDVCLQRRTLRDVCERGRTAGSVREQFFTTVLPMTELYIRPTAVHADLRFLGNTAPVQMVRLVREHMQARQGSFDPPT
jgi:uridine kinase